MKRLMSFVLLMLLASHFSTPVPLAEAAVSLTAPSAILLEPTSQKILFSRAPHRKQPPASTTKIVTALVVLDFLPSDDWVTISSRVEDVEASKLYLKGGERLRARDLLKALLMNSANDAASALAIEVSGSERAFAALMTEKAKSLGARNTRFINASGLPTRGQYTTAYDLALLMREATRNEVIVSILKLKRVAIHTSSGKRYVLKSHNKMLWRPERVIGKTGWTRQARYCFVGLVQEGPSDTIVALLGSRKLWVDLSALVQKITGQVMTKKGKTLSFGQRGKDVAALQLGLKRAGFFKGRATGYFGSKTKYAVTRFQRSRQLVRDGIVGPQTKRALDPYL